ncbi:MAG: hypothetical protein HWQ36_19685 [Nostoc sp. NMS2]|nr:hypothetical protein [Nostoc sp. NMS2]MBN3992667.1 hypothetical protein [Nostoc sp. NMS2]
MSDANSWRRYEQGKLETIPQLWALGLTIEQIARNTVRLMFFDGNSRS